MESTSTGCKNKATDVERYYANKKTLQSQSDAPMDRPHVAVDLSAHLERREACPADVRVAACARHVVTARHALDGHLAARAVLDVVPHLPSLEQPLVLGVAVLARPALVVLHVAVPTDAHEARRALKDRVVRGLAVYLGTVRGWTVMELIRPRLDVGEEGRVHDGVVLVGGKELLRYGKGNLV